jgi:phage recombination protein Bet
MQENESQVQTENDKNVVVYESTGGEVKLSPVIVRQYLVSGNGKISDQEIVMFLALCKYQKLNPFLREIYLVKYSDSSPATMVTGKETFLKRAARNPKYNGHQVGISEDGKKAWGDVWLKGIEKPIHCEVDYDEYVGLKDEYVNNQKTGKKIPNRMWTEKPRTMLKKVALVQALREAFPEDLGGLYSQEEINTITEQLPEKEISQPKSGKPEVTKTVTRKKAGAPQEAPASQNSETREPKAEGKPAEFNALLVELLEVAKDKGIDNNKIGSRLVRSGFLADPTKAEAKEYDGVLKVMKELVEA